MNRIILIGNGFDLAHNLKTSYNNFIDWIIEKKSMVIIENNYMYSDDDFTYELGKYNHNIDISFIKGIFYRNEKCKSIEVEFKNNKHLINNNDFGTIIYKNQFLKSIIHSKNIIGWADIETIFYDELNKLLDDEKTDDKDIVKFNSDFQRIIDLLEEYLKEIENNHSVNKIQEIANHIYKNVITRDLSIEFKKLDNRKKVSNIGEALFEGALETVEVFRGVKVRKLLILDFNYTQTTELYLKKSSQNNTKIIKIHGDLYKQNNPLIFGFGDELDENYNKIEKSRLKGVLKYIKSINYLKTNNYRNMLDFIELDKFQVFILGHSCGITDRTLLNHIFEHDNCAGIKPYYYQKFNAETKEYSNNYIEIISNIARNFKDKNKLRDRVINFQDSEPLMK